MYTSPWGLCDLWLFGVRHWRTLAYEDDIELYFQHVMSHMFNLMFTDFVACMELQSVLFGEILMKTFCRLFFQYLLHRQSFFRSRRFWNNVGSCWKRCVCHTCHGSCGHACSEVSRMHILYKCTYRLTILKIQSVL